jgi:hypothetical protein
LDFPWLELTGVNDPILQKFGLPPSHSLRASSFQ